MSPFVSLRFLQTQSDSRLLSLAGKGHERAFEALVHRYRRQLLAHCRRLLGSEVRAEDALQQALMQAWLALQQDTDVRDARAWLHRIVHNASLNALRGATETTALEDWSEPTGAGDADLDRRLAVREALAGVASLPMLQREALLRTAVDGHSHQEVASALGLSDGAVRGLIYRARATLRSAVTAVTPPPVTAWAASAARPSAPIAQRLAELSAGGGSAGAAAVLLKGGAAAVTAGALVAGVAAPVAHLGRHSRPPAAPSAAGARAVGLGGAAEASAAATAADAAAPAARSAWDAGSRGLGERNGGRSGGRQTAPGELSRGAGGRGPRLGEHAGAGGSDGSGGRGGALSGGSDHSSLGGGSTEGGLGGSRDGGSATGGSTGSVSNTRDGSSSTSGSGGADSGQLSATTTSGGTDSGSGTGTGSATTATSGSDGGDGGVSTTATSSSNSSDGGSSSSTSGSTGTTTTSDSALH